jgi:predicted metalloendopeptidase
VNFGAIGMVIGHELTHGFDDQGRQFDANGDLHDWWVPKDAQEFEKRADCFVQEYNAFPVVDEVKVNGKFTLGENIGDNGGLRIALMALHQWMAATNQDMNKKIDGYTSDQRFFLGFARAWCDNTTPQFSRMRSMMNSHPPGRWRTNGVVQNMPEFQKAFGCKPGQPMVRENACRVW